MQIPSDTHAFYWRRITLDRVPQRRAAAFKPVFFLLELRLPVKEAAFKLLTIAIHFILFRRLVVGLPLPVAALLHNPH